MVLARRTPSDRHQVSEYEMSTIVRIASPDMVSPASAGFRATRISTRSSAATESRFDNVPTTSWDRCPVVPRCVSETIVYVANAFVSTSWVSVFGVIAATETPQLTPPELAVSADQFRLAVQLPEIGRAPLL